ncbi:MAG: hypothetical protein ACPG08_04175, partial [Flavobacteriales bacterium]
MMTTWIPFFTLLAMAPVEENPLKMTLHEMSMKAQALPSELGAERLEELDAMAEWIAEQPAESATE